MTELVTIAGSPTPAEYMEVELSYQGRKKVMRVGQAKDSRAWEDVTEKVAKGEDGHPLPNAVEDLAREHLTLIVDRLQCSSAASE